MSLRSRIYGLIALFAFPFMLLRGVYMINADTVDCGGETMQAGDTCVTTDNGETTNELDYSEQKDDNTAFGWFLIAASPVAGIWGVITVRMIVIERKGKRQQPAQPGGFPQPDPGQQPNPYAPQQQWPQQQPGYPQQAPPMQQQPGFPPNHPQQMQQPYQPPQGQPGQR